MTLAQSEPKIVYKLRRNLRRSSSAVATTRADRRLPRSGGGGRHRRWGRGRPKPDQRVGPRLAETGWGQIHDRQSSIPCFGNEAAGRSETETQSLPPNRLL